MIPSSRGRIVAALHLEFFVRGQAERAADLEDFFNEATSNNRRLEILRKYHVRWNVLNSEMLPPRVVKTLMVPAGVVASVDTLTLLDTEVWARHRRAAARFFEPWTGPERITLSSGPTCFIPRLPLQRMFPPECMPTLGG